MISINKIVQLHRTSFQLNLIFGLTLMGMATVLADTATVTVDVSAQPVSPTRPNVLGQNVLWTQDQFWGNVCNEQGGGIYPNVLTYLKAEHSPILRYPGGLLANCFHWSQTLGPLGSRTFQATGLQTGDQQFPYLGLDEFLQMVTANSGTQALMTVNITPASISSKYSGTSREAAAWVAYCNAATNSTVSIGVDENGYDWKTAGYWATLRSTQGHHASSYGIKYWELGNELNQANEYALTAAQYRDQAIDFIQQMRAVDSSIKIGLLGYTPFSCTTTSAVTPTDVVSAAAADQAAGTPWMKTILGSSALAGKYDFLVMHHYNTFTIDYLANTSQQNNLSTNDAYSEALLAWTSAYYTPFLQQVKAWVSTYNTSKFNNPEIWMTEYMRLSEVNPNDLLIGRNLLTALGSADFLMQNLQTPEVAGAQNFGFNTSDTGTIFPGNANLPFTTRFGTITVPPGSVYIFPLHYVYTLFGSSLFQASGATLLNPVTQCGTYSVQVPQDGYVPSGTLTAPVLRALAAVNMSQNRLDVMFLNKNLTSPTTVTLNLAGFSPNLKLKYSATEFNSWQSNNSKAPYPLFDENNFDMTQNKTLLFVYNKGLPSGQITGQTLTLTLDPHSLTLYTIVPQ